MKKIEIVKATEKINKSTGFISYGEMKKLPDSICLGDRETHIDFCNYGNLGRARRVFLKERKGGGVLFIQKNEWGEDAVSSLTKEEARTSLLVEMKPPLFEWEKEEWKVVIGKRSKKIATGRNFWVSGNHSTHEGDHSLWVMKPGGEVSICMPWREEIFVEKYIYKDCKLEALPQEILGREEFEKMMAIIE